MPILCQIMNTRLEPIIIIAMKRNGFLTNLARMILQVEINHPLRVGIDGVDASGKTTLADELAEVLQHGNRPVIRASIDDFHNPENVRRQRGSLSPEGFYEDSYNYDALIETLLKPLGPHGDRRYRTAVFDLRRDQPIDLPIKTAPQDAILLIDGIFLLRQLLLPYWDLTIYIDVDYDQTMARGITRDAEFYGSIEEAALRYHKRYVPGQRLYHQDANPLDKADILIDNNYLEAPKFLRVPKYLIGDR
jgi:uridine kinase